MLLGSDCLLEVVRCPELYASHDEVEAGETQAERHESRIRGHTLQFLAERLPAAIFGEGRLPIAVLPQASCDPLICPHSYLKYESLGIRGVKATEKLPVLGS